MTALKHSFILLACLFPWVGRSADSASPSRVYHPAVSSEPALGNFTMISRSADGGKTWSRAGQFAHPARGLFTTELFSPREGELHAFLQTYGFGAFVWEDTRSVFLMRVPMGITGESATRQPKGKP